MRVTFLTQWFDPEPAQFRGLPLARELVRRGLDVQVVTGFPNYPSGRLYPGYRIRPWQRERMDGVSVLRLALYPSHDHNAVRRIANYASFAASSAALAPLLADGTDVLYVYHPPPTVGIPAAVFRALRRVPVVYHIADMWPESAVESGMLGSGAVKDIAEALLDRYCKWVYRRCDAITVLSPGFATLLERRGVPSHKIHVVYNWADDSVFRPVPRDQALAKALGLSGRFNVVYAGNLGAFQGLESVIRAAALLQNDVADFQLVFVGTGVEEVRLKKLASELRASNVLFLGHRSTEQMPDINALADALLVHLRDLPFFRTTIPGKTQVSLASGRPMIMAVAGDAADLARRAGAGPIVPPEDPAALAHAIRELRSMPDARRTELGSRGRDFYLRELSLKVGAERMAELFEGMGGPHRAARVRVPIDNAVIPPS
jgi:glycosyltransferase involved in cell wall biosynthesis